MVCVPGGGGGRRGNRTTALESLWQPDLDGLVDAGARNDVDQLRLATLVRPLCSAVHFGLVTLSGDLSPPSQGGHKVHVSLNGLHAAPRLQLPHANRLVVRRREQELAGRVEHKGSNPVVVPRLKCR